MLFSTCFCLLTSFTYHAMDSFENPEDFHIIIGRGEWHKLDNIGAIYAFVLIIGRYTNFKSKFEENLIQFFMLGLGIILQE